MGTPRLTEHARRRCREMEISTKVAKQIVRAPDVTRPCCHGPGPHDAMVATCDRHREYAVVFLPARCVSNPAATPLIVTVLFRTRVRYTRQGATYRALDEAS